MKKCVRSSLWLLILLAAAILCFSGCDTLSAVDLLPAPVAEVSAVSPAVFAPEDAATNETAKEVTVSEDGWYYSRDEVALYIHTYGRLPGNYVTKSEAEQAGWTGGSVEKYLPDCAIGGDRFGNREGQLPKAKGRSWTECDINTHGKASRGPERIVFSNDGLIYYTPDHYDSFRLLYGDP